MRRRGLAGTCIALAAIGMLAAGSAHAAVPAGFYGVSPQKQLGAADVDRMGRAKVGTLRFEIPWGHIDPSPAAGDNNWAATDALVADAARNGIELLPFFYSTPAWVAKDLDRQRCSDTKCFPFAPRSRAALAAWQTFVADAAARYGPDGEFWAQNPQLPDDPIRAWQIWNEQNSPSFYKPKPKPKAFAKLLDASSRGDQVGRPRRRDHPRGHVRDARSAAASRGSRPGSSSSGSTTSRGRSTTSTASRRTRTRRS